MKPRGESVQPEAERDRGEQGFRCTIHALSVPQPRIQKGPLPPSLAEPSMPSSPSIRHDRADSLRDGQCKFRSEYRGRNPGTAVGMTTAWALLVVSSEAQAETLRYQRAWAEGVAKEKGWRIGRFIEGVASGNDGPRRLSRDLLLELRAVPVEVRPAYILMIRLDRIGRGSIVDSQIFVRDLLALGARVYTRNAGEIRLDSAMDELVAAVQMAVARHENDVRRDKAGDRDRNRRSYLDAP